ncbi:MAG: competence protein ComEA [Paraglaciecola psychrophila]|jgi:competence protein ComEA
MKPFNAVIIALLVSLLSSPLWAKDPLPTTVNINTADVATLSAVLVGVGAVKAQSIVAYRKANGLFSTVDSLVSVKGIGESLVKENRQRIKLK